MKFDDVLLLTNDAFPPMSALVRADFAALTRRRPTEEQNTDHYLVVRLGRSQETLLTSLPAGLIGNRFDEQAYGIVVADGMGTAGEMASRLTIAALLNLTLRYARWQVRVDELVAPEIIERITHFYRQIDSALVTVNRTDVGIPLYTTLTGIVTAGRDLFFAHVGHSRAYLFRDGELIQLTHDHTHAVQRTERAMRLVDLTNIASDLHHILTDALGAGTVDPRIDVERITLADGDTVLVCTNGLTDVVGDVEIAGVLGSSRTVDEKAAELVDAAVRNDTTDDVTVVIGRYHVPE